MNIDLNRKVRFTLYIGMSGCEWEDDFTLKELGYDPEIDGDLDEFLEEQWEEWAWNHIDGEVYLDD